MHPLMMEPTAPPATRPLATVKGPPLEALSIIVPCFDESPEVIRETLSDIQTSLAEAGDIEYEILVVDDGSTAYDYKAEEFNSTAVQLLQHQSNRGYGAALKTGIAHARYDWIAITDADGTYPNKQLHKLIDASAGADMVVGARSWQDIGWSRRLPKWLLTRFASFLARSEIEDLNSGMRIFRKELSHQFWSLFPNGFSFTSTITMGAVTNDWEVRYLQIPYFKRQGKSTIQPIRDTLRFFALVSRLAMYFNPSRFFVPLSGLLSALAVLRGLRDYSLNGSFGGLTLILFFMAFQVFFFGLLADIISKTRK